MFQKGSYIGGFDATEQEFCFSVFLDCKEYWFQFSLGEAKEIYQGLINDLDIYAADK